MRTIPVIFSLLSILSASFSSYASVAAGPDPCFATHTVEALTEASSLILTGIITNKSVDGNYVYLTIQPIEILKSASLSSPDAAIRISTNRLAFPILPKPEAPPAGVKALFFLDKQMSGGTADWFLHDSALLGSGGRISTFPIYDLSLQPLTNPDQVLERVRAELRRPPVTTRMLPIYPLRPYEFPNDDRLLPAARKWAQSTESLPRYAAVRVLQLHREPQDVPAIRALLDDSFTFDENLELSPWSGHDYLIRRAAMQELIARGETAPALTLLTPRTDLYRPILVPFLLTLCAPAIAFGLLRKWWRDRRDLPRSTWPHTVITVAMFFFIESSMLSLWLWHRSARIADNAVFARCGLLCECASVPGNLVLEVALHWPGQVSLSHLALTPSSLGEGELDSDTGFRIVPDLNKIYSWPERYKPGFWMGAIDDDAKPFELDPRKPTFHCPGLIVRMGYPYLAGLLMLFPGFWTGIRCVTAARRRHRALSNLCLNCGYDLRGHDAGDPCPECGYARPAAAVKKMTPQKRRQPSCSEGCHH